MLDALDFSQLSFLIGCYIVVADNEINSREVDFLGSKFSAASQSEEMQRAIFSDSEDKPPLNELLRRLTFSHATHETKIDILKTLVELAWSDGFVSEAERSIIFRYASSTNIREIVASTMLDECGESIENEYSQRKLSWQERLTGLAKALFYEIDATEEIKDKGGTQELLEGAAFAKKIEEITEDAFEDLNKSSETVSNLVDYLTIQQSEIREIRDSLGEAKRKDDNSIEAVLESIDNVQASFETSLHKSIKDIEAVLEKKRRNIRYFTIAFMGRTKAGKSTLHKVITHSSKDDIGCGKLRTTRYNRSWYWEKIRIVDTPGIGAPGGSTDTEIACSIIDEADLICYVVTNDSIQQTEFDFLEGIKERNKPLYIILNFQSNISHPVRLKKFLKQPTAWLNTDPSNPLSLQGHYNRINEQLSGKYNMSAVRIIPIQLLAALRSYDQDRDSAECDLLRLGSNIGVFIKDVKMTVYHTGSLKKSLSIIDSSAYAIHVISERLSSSVDELNKRNNVLKSNRNSFEEFYSKEKSKLVNQILTTIENTTAQLKNRAANFAAEEYENKQAGDKWSKDDRVREIMSKFSEKLSRLNDVFSHTVKERIEEIMTDMNFELNNMDYENIKGKGIFNTRKWLRIASALGTLAATLIWNPAGLAVAALFAVGFVFNWFVSLLKSKDTKIKEATEELKKQLYESIDKNMNDTKKEILATIDAKTKEVEENIQNIFTTFINNVDQIVNHIDSVISECDLKEKALNSLEAIRIINYLEVGEPISVEGLDDKMLTSQYPVVRNWTTQSLKINFATQMSAENEAEASEITQMNIKFE